MADYRIAYFINLDSIHCKKWVKHLSKTNHCIIITYQGMSPADIDLPGVRVYTVLPKRFPVKNFILRWITIFRIRLILKQNKIEVLHSMYCYPNSIWANYFKNFKKVITTRGSDVLLDYKSILLSDHRSLIYLKNKLEKAFRDAVFITGTSLQQKNYLISKNVDPLKISVIRTGIEPEHFSIKQTSQTKNIYRILSPRSVQQNYNIHNMLLALKRILQADPGLQIKFDQVLFNINPDYLNTINQLITDNGLKDHVNFIQPYDLRSVSDTYAQYDLAIMIPESDGTPVSALEAMINKKPLIISKLPYDADLINEDCCWFVDPKDPEQIANCILKIRSERSEIIDQKLEKAYNNVIQNANTYNEMKKVSVLYKSMEA